MGRAGDDLGVTHGAISHQIRSLEESLGVKLFIRSGNRLQLTEFGERLLEAVTDGFDRILDGTKQLNPNDLSGSLVVGFTQTAGASWIAQFITNFHRRYPKIEVHAIEVKPHQKDIPREIDIAICYGKPNAGDKRVEELVAPSIFPVCSPRMLHGERELIKPEHLVHFPLLHDGLENWTRWFSAQGIEIPDHAEQIYFFNANLALNAARSGYGLALCNRFEVKDDLLEGRLVKLANHTLPDLHSYFLLADEPDKQPLKARIFEDELKNLLE